MNWRYAIIVPMVLNGIWSIVNFMFVPNTPKDVGLETEETKEQDRKALAQGLDKDATPRLIHIHIFIYSYLYSYIYMCEIICNYVYILSVVSICRNIICAIYTYFIFIYLYLSRSYVFSILFEWIYFYCF